MPEEQAEPVEIANRWRTLAITALLGILGMAWQADSVDVCDGSDEEYGLRLQRRLTARLEGGLYGENIERDAGGGARSAHRDAVVISYWWD